MLVMVTGLPATGKSTIARHLAGRLRGVLLRTDLIRKELFPKPRYTREEKEMVYTVMLLLAKYLLRSGATVVLDGTFYRRSLRRRVYDVAAGAKSDLRVIECVAPEHVIERRMERRAHRKRKLSDADLEVYRKIAAQFEAIRREHITVDTSMLLKQNLREIMRRLKKGKG